MKPRFFTFWAINAPLDQTRLRRQLEQFRAIGFDGVVWHPRFYPGKPPYLGDCYLAELSDVILHANSLGLAFWLYDEDGWPSGTVGGQLLKKYPGVAQRRADLVTEKPERCLAEFEIRNPKSEIRKWFLAERVGRGVDYFNPDLARHFIELTYERYRTGLKPEAWAHVEAIFCDEPEFGLGHAYDSLSKHGAIPWTPKLPEIFRQRYGEDLIFQIPNLFFAGDGRARHSVRAVSATPKASGGSRRAEDSPPYQTARINFWELLTDVFNASFTAPINDWCRQHGKLFTAHLKGEEHPLFQVPTNGSCHQFFRNLDLPAIDALERYPGNNFYPRQLSSAARQFGSGRCMVEAFGGAGWGATPEDLEKYLFWLGSHGLTDFVMHLSQYRLDSAAMHDWPPSQPLHLTWREAYPEVLKRVRRELENNPRPPADTLMIAPNRGIMANYEPQEFLQTNVHNAETYPDSVAGKINRRFLEQVEELHRAGVNYDIVDERTLEQFGRHDGKELVIGNCKYQRVIVAAGCRLNKTARVLVQSLVAGAPASGPTRTGTNEKRAGAETGAPVPVHWSLENHPVNSLLLECANTDGGWFEAKFVTAAGLPDAKLELVFADEIAEVVLNGKSILLRSSEEGSVARVASQLLPSANTLRFQTLKPHGQRPFVWLRGLFRVMSAGPFVAGPNNTVRINGPFTLHPARDAIESDLIADGFPFLREPVVVAASVTLPAASSLTLDGVKTDVARLWVDESDFGWTWRTKGEFTFAVKLPADTHRLRLELVPNTFNGFGPHHYFAGDWHVVSPDQIKGVRNFADAPEAPAQTHVAAWNFRRFTLPSAIIVA